MYRTKKDVDKYVETLKVNYSVKELTSRAYSVARLYYDVGDYNSCIKYVEQYLAQKDNNAAAHKLLGQACRKLGHSVKALTEFKTAYDLDPSQNSIILDICELLLEDISLDSGSAKYWCEKALTVFPKNPVTFSLQLKLLSTNNPDPEAMTGLLTAEIQSKPKDITLHSRLLKHYMNINKISEAFSHCINYEFQNNSLQHNSALWYENVLELLNHSSMTQKDWKFNIMILSSYDRLITLSLNEIPSGSTKSLVETSISLHKYDQAINHIIKRGPPPENAEFHNCIVKHHQGQLAFHLATFLLKKASKDQLSWKDATKYALPLMFISFEKLPPNKKSKWLDSANELQKNAISQYNLESAFRCSQSGHFILSTCNNINYNSMDSIYALCSNKDWKSHLYELLFKSNSDMLMKKQSSYVMSDDFKIEQTAFPKKGDVTKYDNECQLLNPSSLHHMVWTILNYDDMSEFQCNVFDMLNIRSSNYHNCGPETIDKLDVLAFLYCSALTAQKNKSSYGSTDKAKLLPANITDLLCAPPQLKWWDCAYKYCQNFLGLDLTDIRLTLSRGIETVRCIDNHGLDPEMVFKLAKIFEKLKDKTNDINFKNAIESRALLYYTTALNLFEKIKSNKIVRYSDSRMFDYTCPELGKKELNELINQCRIHAATIYLNKTDYQEAIQLLEKTVKSSDIYYQLADAYMKLSFDESNRIGSDEKQIKSVGLLLKAKKYADKAMTMVKKHEENGKTALNFDLQKLIDNIESHLQQHDVEYSDITHSEYDDTKYNSDDNHSFPKTEYTVNRLNSYFNNISSTPKQRANTTMANYKSAIDSQYLDASQINNKTLENIETQIKKLQKNDSIVNSFMEQTKSWFQENRDLGKIIGMLNNNIQNTTDQFKELKISVDQVKNQINECKKECQDVADLKKEIAELKTKVNKLACTNTEPLDESDLYSIDDDYQTKENAPNFAAHVPFTHPAMAGVNPRAIPQQLPVGVNPYLFGQNMFNLYKQFPHYPQMAPPATSTLFDPARAQINFPPMYGGEPMYHDYTNFIPTVPPMSTIPPMSAIPSMSIPSISTITTIPSMTNFPQVSTVLSEMTNPNIPAVHSNVSMSQGTIITSTPVSYKSSTVPTDLKSKDTIKNLPVNVVITSSDPLPTTASGPQPVLSVTIPPKHIKGLPHNYQISMPSSYESQTQNTSSPIHTFGNNNLVSTMSSTPNFPTSSTFKFNAQNLTKLNSTSDEINVTLSPNKSLNKSRTISEKSNTSVESYDPCPDFKPIIPLPDEVNVTTGEENEEVLFNSKAKLYRFADKQWKERGIGEMKLLKHKETNKVRVLMRREQVHKICANHLIAAEMEIQQKNNDPKSYLWVANDYADETFVLEKFCIRFKTPEIAIEFKNVFEKACEEAKANKTPSKPKDNKKEQTKVDEIKKPADVVKQENKTVIGGFTFNSTPSFKNVNEEKPTVDVTNEETKKPNPFSTFSFKLGNTESLNDLLINSKTENDIANSSFKQNTLSSVLNTSDTAEEFEPTIEFKPVVPLPALVDTKTGEEDEHILFEHRTKLLRYISSTKEWKERGLGNIKLLVQRNNDQKIRLLMRREQVMKICCNHSITKEMAFEKMPKMDKAVTWCAQDFSEGELVKETFCARFKTVEICNDFLDAIKCAQAKLIVSNRQNMTVNIQPTDTKGFGDKFKPKAGSWHCDSCYTNNLESFTNCACCDQPKPGTNIKETNPLSQGWGDKFKPKQGTWECKSCCVRNDQNASKCISCSSPKDPNAPKVSSNILPTKTEFSFGIPKATGENITNAPKQSWSFGINPNLNSKPNVQSSSSFSFGIPNENSESFAQNQPINNVAKLNLTPSNNTPTENKEISQILTALNPTNEKFSFTLNPNKSDASKNDNSSDSEEENGDDDDGAHIHFTPVVPLPDKVNVVTGEEDETEIYIQRAKLFRFVSGEWKERGIGMVKILKNKNTGKYRVVMRWEQLLKICLNHMLTSEIMYTKKDDKSWLFVASDYSEGELQLRQFCLRFKTKDIAIAFKNAVDNAISDKIVITDNEKSEDVVFINEIQASSEDKQKAKDLMLPENFFTYKNKASCPGCRGCDEEDKRIPEISNQVVSEIVSPVFLTPKSSNNTTDLFLTPINSLKNDSSKKSDESRSKETNEYLKEALKKPTNLSAKITNDKKSILATPKLAVSNANETKTVVSETNLEPTANHFKFSANPVIELKAANSAVTSNIFGNSDFAKKTEIKSIFGNEPANNDNIFSSNTTGSLFGPSSTNIVHSFGDSKTNNAFSDSLKTLPLSNNSQKNSAEPAVVFKSDESLSFSALSSTNCGFNSLKSENFKWAGEGQQLFGESAKHNNKTDKNEESVEEENCDAPEEYDPHYDPIVPMPDEIVVTTGEEDEEKIFCSRCKLYRFDDKLKEWKERGVGDIKILYHPTKCTYRLLLRREQIHKVVLNMLLHMDLEFLPMNKSDRAWTWAGMNYAENSSQQEKLAVRFKSVELAKQFQDKAVECIRKLQAADAKAIREKKEAEETVSAPAPLMRLPKTLQASARVDNAISKFATNLVEQPKDITTDKTNNPDPKPTVSFSFDNNMDKSSNLFSKANITNDIKPKTGLFGSDNVASFSQLKSENTNESSPKTIFSSDNFATFSQLKSENASFKKMDNFKWAGEGQQLFVAPKTVASGNSDVTNVTNEDDNDDNTEEYDPHYDPIVPMPDEITVTTGEEDEEKLFCSRCKLYRFDDKLREWKERGVGELKILYHPVKCTYRLLMRREQIHKVVLNMLLHMDLEFLPMNKSDRAWTWAGMNYAENSSQHEALAVRFKSVELANKFKTQTTECIEKLKCNAGEKPKVEPPTVESPSTPLLRLPKNVGDNSRADNKMTTFVSALVRADSHENGSVVVEPPTELEHHYDDDNYYEDDENYEGYNNEDDSYYFSSEAVVTVQHKEEEVTCAEGFVELVYDQELYTPKVQVTNQDTGEILSTMILHSETELSIDSNICTWTENDFTEDGSGKTITVEFPDSEQCMNFYERCETCKEALYVAEEAE